MKNLLLGIILALPVFASAKDLHICSTEASPAEWLLIYEEWSEGALKNTRLARNRFNDALIFYIKSGFNIVGTFTHADGETMIKLSKNLE